MELLVERPIDAIAIDEVVAAAGVGKGSFFNHFADKGRFASAVSREIRLDVEQWVARINEAVADPLERLAGGMVAAYAYATAEPQRTFVLARTASGMLLKDHPINTGLLNDLRGAVAEGTIELPSEEAGVLFWLGCCQMLMGNIVESDPESGTTEGLLLNMLSMGLRGLGVLANRIATLVEPGLIRSKLALLDQA